MQWDKRRANADANRVRVGSAASRTQSSSSRSNGATIPNDSNSFFTLASKVSFPQAFRVRSSFRKLIRQTSRQGEFQNNQAENCSPIKTIPHNDPALQGCQRAGVPVRSVNFAHLMQVECKTHAIQHAAHISMNLRSFCARLKRAYGAACRNLG
jgi:hypothetical protein